MWILKCGFLRNASHLLAVCSAVLLFSLSAFSQANSGRILGSITDQTGGAITGATVSVRDIERGTTRTLTTDDAGAYSAPSLIPGTYVVKVEFQGFKTVERQNVVLEVGKEVRVDLASPCISVAERGLKVPTACARSTTSTSSTVLPRWNRWALRAPSIRSASPAMRQRCCPSTRFRSSLPSRIPKQNSAGSLAPLPTSRLSQVPTLSMARPTPLAAPTSWMQRTISSSAGSFPTEARLNSRSPWRTLAPLSAGPSRRTRLSFSWVTRASATPSATQAPSPTLLRARRPLPIIQKPTINQTMLWPLVKTPWPMLEQQT